MMLEADVRLRSGGESLDAALRALHECCVDPAETWRARNLMRTLDRLTESSVFMDLYRGQARARSFPDLSGLYGKLGLRVTARGIQLDDRAPLAAGRRAIMGRPVPAAAAGASSAAPAPAGAP
jgi:hypothetical protein